MIWKCSRSVTGVPIVLAHQLTFFTWFFFWSYFLYQHKTYISRYISMARQRLTRLHIREDLACLQVCCLFQVFHTTGSKKVPIFTIFLCKLTITEREPSKDENIWASPDRNRPYGEIYRIWDFNNYRWYMKYR